MPQCKAWGIVSVSIVRSHDVAHSNPQNDLPAVTNAPNNGSVIMKEETRYPLRKEDTLLFHQNAICPWTTTLYQ